MGLQLSKNSDYVAFASSGTTGATSLALEVDMVNYEGIEFIGVAGTTSTAATLTLSTAASTTATFVNISSTQGAAGNGTSKSTGAGAVVVVDLYRPRKRWIKGTLSTTASARLFLVARKYDSRKHPITNTSTAIVTTVVSPNT